MENIKLNPILAEVHRHIGDVVFIDGITDNTYECMLKVITRTRSTAGYTQDLCRCNQIMASYD